VDRQRIHKNPVNPATFGTDPAGCRQYAIALSPPLDSHSRPAYTLYNKESGMEIQPVPAAAVPPSPVPAADVSLPVDPRSAPPPADPVSGTGTVVDARV
jgi:hypothetical protein